MLALWAATSAVDLGITTGEAFKQVVPVIVVTNLLSIVWAFIFGSMIDRINRVTAMVIAMGLGAIAYGSIIFVDTPLNYSYLPIFILISASAIGTVIATGSLIGQEAPIRERGSVIGVSAFFGRSETTRLASPQKRSAASHSDALASTVSLRAVPGKVRQQCK